MLTHPRANARRTLISNTTIHPRSGASSAQKCDADDCQFARSDCAAGVFITRTFGDRRATNVIRLVESGRRRVARTLSLGFWQEKNFSSRPALRLFVLAKTGLSRESPPPIRRCGFWRRAMHRDFYGERPVHDARAWRRRRCRRRHVTRRSEAELGLEQIVHRLRIGLASG